MPVDRSGHVIEWVGVEGNWPIPRTLWVFRWCSFISPADPSLTSSSVSAALETVGGVGDVEGILETPVLRGPS